MNVNREQFRFYRKLNMSKRNETSEGALLNSGICFLWRTLHFSFKQEGSVALILKFA